MNLIQLSRIAALLSLGTAPLAANELKLHPELEAAASKVDTDASHLELSLVKEDMEMILPYAELVGEMLTELEGTEAKVDVRSILGASGLLDLSAVAKSNARHGGSWLNKTYYATGGSRKGLFSLLAGDSEEFQVARMAQSGTDLAFELRADLSQLPGLIESIGGALGVAGDAKEELAREVDHLGMTIEEALKRTSFRVQLAMNFELGDESEANTLPVPQDLICRIDGMTRFWNKAGEAWLEECESKGVLAITRSESDGMVTYAVTSEEEVIEVIVVESTTDTIWLSTSAEALKQSMEQGPRLADDPEFQATWAGMPQTGNAMAYVSPRLFRAGIGSVLPLLGGQVGPEDESGESTGAIDRLLLKLTTDLIAADTGLALSASSDADGLLIASKLPFPGKYLDDLFVGDLLYDFVADPEMVALLDGDVAMTLKAEELEELIEESRNEMRQAIQGMGLDEKTTKELLDGMAKELRKDLGGEGGGGLEFDSKELSLSPEQKTAVVEETLERMKKGVKEAGLDQETTRKMLESIEQAAREEVRRVLETEGGNKDGKSGE